MFINLTARKDNGDFYITSSDVLSEAQPELTEDEVKYSLLIKAKELFLDGWNITLTQEQL